MKSDSYYAVTVGLGNVKSGELRRDTIIGHVAIIKRYDIVSVSQHELT